MSKKLPYFLIVILVAFLISLPFFIKVSTECKSQFGECPAELESRIKNQESGNLWRVKKETAKILKSSQLVSDFSMQYKLPNTLLVNIVVKKPLYAIKDNLTGKMFSVEAGGKILSEVESTSLPTVVQDGTIPNVMALDLILGVYQMYQVRYGMITNDALAVDMPTGVRVIFPLKDERGSEVLLGALRLIYAKVTTSYLGVYSQIDMRYKNPVLR